MSYALDYPIAAQASESARAAFIRRTYAHLAGAIAAFAAIDTFLLNLPGIEELGMAMRSHWWLVLVLMMGASWIADYWAQSNTSMAMQYLGLGLYVVAEAFLFVPLLCIIQFQLPNSEGVILTAGIYTLAIVAGLTVTCF